MGYGGTGYATVTVNIAQADVQAIVDGITGTYGRTLTDVDNDLGNYLYYNGNTVASMLQWVLDQMGNANSSLYNLQNFLSGSWYGALYDGNSAVTYLNWIASNTGGLSNLQYYLSGSWGGPLTDIANNAYWIANNTGGLQGYLAGWSGGPLTNIDGNTSWTASNTSSIANYLYDGNRAIDYLSWINSNLGSMQSLLSGSWGGPLTDAAYNLNQINYNTGYTASNIGNLQSYLFDWNTYQSAASLLADIRNLLQQLSFDGSGRLRVTTTG